MRQWDNSDKKMVKGVLKQWKSIIERGLYGEYKRRLREESRKTMGHRRNRATGSLHNFYYSIKIVPDIILWSSRLEMLLISFLCLQDSNGRCTNDMERKMLELLPRMRGLGIPSPQKTLFFIHCLFTHLHTNKHTGGLDCSLPLL